MYGFMAILVYHPKVVPVWDVCNTLPKGGVRLASLGIGFFCGLIVSPLFGRLLQLEAILDLTHERSIYFAIRVGRQFRDDCWRFIFHKGSGEPVMSNWPPYALHYIHKIC